MPTTYAIPNGRTVMDATTFTGNGTTQTIYNTDLGTVGFKPDFIWQKNRSISQNHYLVDSVRGTQYVFRTNATNAQTTDANFVTSINTNGWSMGSSNFTNGENIVGWQWQAGQGTTSNNTSGTVTSTVSANTTAGFSIVQFTSPTTGNTGTIGHGLGAVPNFIMYREYAQVGDTIVYHSSVGATKYLDMTTTDAATTNANVWNNTTPTSTVFSIGTSFSGSHPTIAYCWTAIPGFSAFGSYTGNGSADGPFVYLGFRPKFVLIKNTSTTGYWMLVDSTRGTYNIVGPELYPNVSDAEDTTDRLDLLSNGFKIRVTSAFINGNTNIMIYAAFAENPFKYANAR